MPFTDWMLPCIFKALTGYSCPWCGLQRGIAHLLSGEVLAGLQLWPPMIPVMLMFAALVVQIKFPSNQRLTMLYMAYALVVVSLISNFIIKNFNIW